MALAAMELERGRRPVLPGPSRATVDPSRVSAAPPLLRLATAVGNRAMGRLIKREAPVATGSPKRSIARQRPRDIDAGLPPAPRTPRHWACGPDVGEHVHEALNATARAFSSWSPDIKDAACGALDDVRIGMSAWDILDLNHFNNDWIHQQHRPSCATAGASPGCGDSVEVQGECFYSGSVNYVVFGQMCRLCHDHYRRLGAPRAGDFTEARAIRLVNLYPGKILAGNYRTCLAWTRAGYHGWRPRSPVPTPSGDRSHCWPICELPCRREPFEVHWSPRYITSEAPVYDRDKNASTGH